MQDEANKAVSNASIQLNTGSILVINAETVPTTRKNLSSHEAGLGMDPMASADPCFFPSADLSNVALRVLGIFPWGTTSLVTVSLRMGQDPAQSNQTRLVILTMTYTTTLRNSEIPLPHLCSRKCHPSKKRQGTEISAHV